VNIFFFKIKKNFLLSALPSRRVWLYRDLNIPVDYAFQAFFIPSFVNQHKLSDLCCFLQTEQFCPTQKVEGLYIKIPDCYPEEEKKFLIPY